ncbi:helix-turn-helix domain-containing protein [Jiangella asiatica]|uniref:XRE family transcriptional regulator n=1 Tax=Jiangella asiatica TaxID=2530372 RepID=A0A4V2Z2Y1_9ACTN|nr:helix-turn-helix transcriptional regulator [Jiangella asiatica]TDE10618.1 XRE family transcriptional regulator [Jiangella asiatica]
MDQEPVGEVIRRARAVLGYSQYGFADELVRVSGNGSLTRDEVARWERGKRIPGPYWRQWLSRVLQVPAGELAAAAKVTRDARSGADRRVTQPV